MDSIFDKLGPIVKRYEEIESTMALPEVATDFERVQTLAKERAALEELVGISRRWQKLAEEHRGLESMVRAENDPELAAMAREELEEVDTKNRAVGASP